VTKIHLSRHRVIAIYREPAERSPSGRNTSINPNDLEPPAEKAWPIAFDSCAYFVCGLAVVAIALGAEDRHPWL
jgi:hypothetical protein